MKLATTTGDFAAYTSSQHDAAKWISEAGFKYLDYSFSMDLDAKTGVFSLEYEKFIADLLNTVDALGVKFVQAHAPMGKPILRGETHKDFVEMNKVCIRSCKRLDIQNLVIHTGYEKGISKEECFERNKEFFDELMPCAEENGVYILVENFNKMCVEKLYWIDNAPDLRAFIDYYDHPLLQAVWDAGHANMQDMPQREALNIMGSTVRALHVQDNLSDTDAHLAPFFGSLSVSSLIEGLKDINYSGYFTFEATNFFLPEIKRRHGGDDRLLLPPLGLRREAEKLLYQIGEYILEAYDMYEE